MAGNVIYRGPIKDEPETVSDKTVAGAYLPGILVTESASALTVATGANIEDDLLVLSNRRFYGQDVATAYASGDTGVAYRPRPGEIYQVRVAATTYAKSDPLTVGASGYLEDAGANVFSHSSRIRRAHTPQATWLMFASPTASTSQRYKEPYHARL